MQAWEYDLRVLGECAVRAQTRAAAFPERGYQLAALAICGAGGAVLRADAARLLWPELTDAKARANLRQLVLRMNRAMAGGVVVAVGDHLRIAAHVTVDLREVVSGLDRGATASLRAAVIACGGPLLAGVTGTGGALHDWLARQRVQLSARLAEAARQVLDTETRYGAAQREDLRTFCARVIALFPDDARVLLGVATAYARTGQYDLAQETLAQGGLSARDPEAGALARRISAARGYAQPAASGPEPVRVPRVPRVALLRPRAAGDDAGCAPADLLADRIVHEIAAGLARYQSFSVLAPYSTFAVADQHGLPRDNSLLRADYALSGDVGGVADGAGLRLRLTHVESRVIFWSADFPLRTETLGMTLRLLMSRVVMAVAAELERRVRDDLRMRAPASALLHFLEGRALQARCDLPHVRRARSEFARALVVDEGFAPAHARIAETLFVEWILCGGRDPELLSAARARAAQAVRLEPSDPTGHWVSGAVALYQRRWDEVGDAYAAAESIAPHDADMLLEYGDALSHLGEHAAAEALFQKAIDLNPLPPDRYHWFGASIAFNRLDFAAAAERCDRIGDTTVALGLRTTSYAQAGRIDEARIWARRLKQTLPGMAAEDLYRISPDREGDLQRSFYVNGLRMAGLK